MFTTEMGVPFLQPPKSCVVTVRDMLCGVKGSSACVKCHRDHLVPTEFLENALTELSDFLIFVSNMGDLDTMTESYVII